MRLGGTGPGKSFSFSAERLGRDLSIALKLDETRHRQDAERGTGGKRHKLPKREQDPARD